MLDFRKRSRFEVVSARVVGREAGRGGRELKIDKGSRDGVRKNLAVMTVDGLVGRVSAVDVRSAFVRPLNGRHCRVSARVTRTRMEGILEWTPNRGLHLTFLPYRAEVRPGDEVVSSGLGGVFPQGVLIGDVARVDPDRTEGSRRVTVRAAVDFGSLEEVFVVVRQRAEEDLPPTETPASPDSGGA
jgi:rod shape-determining protein MreC